MAKFLDENGVKKLWSRIQEYVYECCCSKGGGDVGYECKDGYETFWKDSVQTTRGSGDWSQRTVRDGTIIDAEKIRVIFQGTAYDLGVRVTQSNTHTYYEYGEFTSEGDPILTNLPIAILSYRVRTDNVLKANSSGMLRADLREETVIYTRKSGIYNIEIQTPGTVVETTECFQKAVKSVSGYDCTTSFEKAFSESGATEEPKTDRPCTATLSYTGFIDADEIKVVFNGTEYTCPKTAMGNDAVYGSTDFSFTDYPFVLGFSESYDNTIFTKEPTDFDITVFAVGTTAKVTPCFETAVKTALCKGELERTSFTITSFLKAQYYNPANILIPAHSFNVAQLFTDTETATWMNAQNEYQPTIQGFYGTDNEGIKCSVETLASGIYIRLQNTTDQDITLDRNSVWVDVLYIGIYSDRISIPAFGCGDGK